MTKINDLVNGYKAFYEQYFNGKNSLYEELTTMGQRPKFLVIACSDSRVDPALILKAKPGDLFVVRNVANLVPPNESDNGHHGTSAAIEFAVCGLGVSDIIVLGHTQCGGIQNLIETANEKPQRFSFIGRWMDIAQESAKITKEKHGLEPLQDQVTRCCQYSIKQSLENLKTFDFISERLNKGTLAIHGWQFDIVNGTIVTLDLNEDKFKPI